MLNTQSVVKDFKGPMPSSIRSSFLNLAARLKEQDGTLYTVQLQDQTISDDEFDLLLRYLPEHHASEKLVLRGLNFGDTRLKKLMHALAYKPMVREIDLMNNFLSEKVIDDIAAFIDLHPELQAFNLSVNKVADGGAMLLADHFEKHPQLERVGLDYCGIYKAGCERLNAVALAHPKKIQISLKQNPSSIMAPRMLSRELALG
jgi:Ran GTPase-activating protein (RanGAP) involved in mRNA processing and transport